MTAAARYDVQVKTSSITSLFLREAPPFPYNWDLTEKTKVFKYYDILASIFIVVLVISNLVGQKICAFGPFRVSGAQLLFPITYIFGDIFTEVYGYGGSRRVIWI